MLVDLHSPPLKLRMRHAWIRSQWKRWFLPTICALPYCLSLIWLVERGEIWIAQVLLAPIVMGCAIAFMTLWLARCEYGPRRRLR